MKFIVDQNTKRLRMQMSEDEYQRLKIDADKLGIAVDEMIQTQMGAHAHKMFPQALRRQ